MSTNILSCNSFVQNLFICHSVLLAVFFPTTVELKHEHVVEHKESEDVKIHCLVTRNRGRITHLLLLRFHCRILLKKCFPRSVAFFSSLPFCCSLEPLFIRPSCLLRCCSCLFVRTGVCTCFSGPWWGCGFLLRGSCCWGTIRACIKEGNASAVTRSHYVLPWRAPHHRRVLLERER